MRCALTATRPTGASLAASGSELRDFSGAFAPAGDLLAYLAGAKNVRTTGEDRYQYEIDGPEFAAYIRDQMERYLVEAGELPPSVRLESAELYRDVTGDGESGLAPTVFPAAWR